MVKNRPSLALACTQPHCGKQVRKFSMCVCFDSGTKSYTFAVQSLLFSHVTCYLLASLLYDQNHAFLRLRHTGGRTHFTRDWNGAQGAEVPASGMVPAFPLSMLCLTLMEGAEPPFPVVFASNKVVINDLTFPWEQTFTSLTVASLAEGLIHHVIQTQL